MHVEANRSPYLNPADRPRGAQRPQQPAAAGQPDFARHAEAVRPNPLVRPSPQATEALPGGGPNPPPSPHGSGIGNFQPPELIAVRYGGEEGSLAPQAQMRSGGGGPAGGHGPRPDSEDLPRGLQQLVEVQAMSQPDVLGRGGRLDLTV